MRTWLYHTSYSRCEWVSCVNDWMMPSSLYIYSPTPNCDYYRQTCSRTRTCTFPLTCTTSRWRFSCSTRSICKYRQECSRVEVKRCCKGYRGSECNERECKIIYISRVPALTCSNHLQCVCHILCFLPTICYSLLWSWLCEWWLYWSSAMSVPKWLERHRLQWMWGYIYMLHFIINSVIQDESFPNYGIHKLYYAFGAHKQ